MEIPERGQVTFEAMDRSLPTVPAINGNGGADVERGVSVEAARSATPVQITISLLMNAKHVHPTHPAVAPEPRRHPSRRGGCATSWGARQRCGSAPCRRFDALQCGGCCRPRQGGARSALRLPRSGRSDGTIPSSVIVECGENNNSNNNKSNNSTQAGMMLGWCCLRSTLACGCRAQICGPRAHSRPELSPLLCQQWVRQGSHGTM